MTPEVEKYHFAPYLAAYQIGSSIHVGGLPPHAGIIEDAPKFLPGLIGHLGQPREKSEVLGYLVSCGVDEASAEIVFEEMCEAGFVIPALDSPTSRYARHHLYYQSLGLDPVKAQAKLCGATVGLIGTGGIGSNVATLLAAAGVGKLVISDGDTVEMSNLTRQTLYSESSVDRLKVDVAQERLESINSEVTVVPVPRGFDGPDLVSAHFADCDFIVLSADSPYQVHEWLCAAAVPLGIPYSSAGYIEGYAVVGPLVEPRQSACYECLRNDTDVFRHMSAGDEPPQLLNSRIQAPSFGPLNFYVASVQANEAIRHLLGLPTQTSSTRLLVDFTDYRHTWERFERNPGCSVCGEEDAVSAQPPRVLEQIAAQYEAERADSSFNSLLLDPLMDKLIPFTADPGRMALDVGCGTGEMTRLLADRGYQVTGIDVEPAMLRIAADRTDSDAVAYREGTLGDLTGEGFHKILCLNVLDWIEDLQNAVQRLSEALLPGGEIIISVPHPFKDSGSWAKHWNGERWVYDDFAVTGHYFSEGPIEKSREDSSGNTVVARTLTFKRTVESYVAALMDAGLTLTGLYEPAPLDVADAPTVLVEKAARVPYFLVLRAKAPEKGQ
ncbi:TOMM precursor leader peptide-binding protein [Streptomyces sp. NPDC048521]|uniref:TOMM precursor leader peptide-binding protein n=1 Tax=Streptomyces sp. NPDC048521 TaxID=3365566 RepID=UPI003719AC53